MLASWLEGSFSVDKMLVHVSQIVGFCQQTAEAYLKERHEVSWRVVQGVLRATIGIFSQGLALYVRMQVFHVAQTPAW